MANRIQKGYERHIQESSPDMDKLWAKIEQRIDEKAPAVQEQPQKPQITVKRGEFMKYAAVAACLIAVVAGTVVFMNSKDDKVKTADSVAYKSEYKAEDSTAQDRAPAEQKSLLATQDAKTDSYTDKIDAVDGYDDKANKTAADEEKAKSEAVATAESESPKERIKSLMETQRYTSADKEQKVKMVEELAEEMKKNGEITDYAMKIKEVNSRIEITLPDGEILGMMLL